jgi:hypothetical protein
MFADTATIQYYACLAGCEGEWTAEGCEVLQVLSAYDALAKQLTPSTEYPYTHIGTGPDLTPSDTTRRELEMRAVQTTPSRVVAEDELCRHCESSVEWVEHHNEDCEWSMVLTHVENGSRACRGGHLAELGAHATEPQI